LEASRQTIDSLESGNLGTAIRDKTMIMNYPEIPDNSNCPLPSSSDDTLTQFIRSIDTI